MLAAVKFTSVFMSIKIKLTSHRDWTAQSHQRYVVVVPRWVVVSIQYYPIHTGTSQQGHLCAAWHHPPASQLLFAAVRPKKGGKDEMWKETLTCSHIHWKWCTGRLCLPSEAVGGSDYPTRWHQCASTCVMSTLLQADLPGPVLNVSVCTPNNTVLRTHLSTVW